MIRAAVVDASVVVKWVVEEPGSDLARTLATAALEAPDLLFTECANILWKKARVGDLDKPEAEARLGALLRAPVRLAPDRDLLKPALRLAVELGHPVCDCLYLALAQVRKLPLVTADTRLVLAVKRRRRDAPRVLSLNELRQASDQ